MRIIEGTESEILAYLQIATPIVQEVIVPTPARDWWVFDLGRKSSLFFTAGLPDLVRRFLELLAQRNGTVSRAEACQVLGITRNQITGVTSGITRRCTSIENRSSYIVSNYWCETSQDYIYYLLTEAEDGSVHKLHLAILQKHFGEPQSVENT